MPSSPWRMGEACVSCTAASGRRPASADDQRETSQPCSRLRLREHDCRFCVDRDRHARLPHEDVASQVLLRRPTRPVTDRARDHLEGGLGNVPVELVLTDTRCVVAQAAGSSFSTRGLHSRMPSFALCGKFFPVISTFWPLWRPLEGVTVMLGVSALRDTAKSRQRHRSQSCSTNAKTSVALVTR